MKEGRKGRKGEKEGREVKKGAKVGDEEGRKEGRTLFLRALS